MTVADFTFYAFAVSVVTGGLLTVVSRSPVHSVLWLILSFLRGAGTVVMPRSPMLYARPLPETAFLVEAAGDPHAGASDWSDTLYRSMAQLKAQDRKSSPVLLRTG